MQSSSARTKKVTGSPPEAKIVSGCSAPSVVNGYLICVAVRRDYGRIRLSLSIGVNDI
jgi:hypothetical protein